MYADGDSLQYIDKMAAESYLNVRSYPPTLNKKVGNLVFPCSFITVIHPVCSFSFWPADNAAKIFPQLHERAPAEGRRQHRTAGRRRAGEAALSVPLVQNKECHCPAPEQRHRPDQLLPGELSIQTFLLRFWLRGKNTLAVPPIRTTPSWSCALSWLRWPTSTRNETSAPTNCLCWRSLVAVRSWPAAFATPSWWWRSCWTDNPTRLC